MNTSQLYRRKKGGLVTEPPAGPSGGVALAPGSASNFNWQYLVSPYVRMDLLFFLMGVLRGRSKFAGSCDSLCVLSL